MYIGIDNGKQGGIVMIDKDKSIVFKCAIPTIAGPKNPYDKYAILGIFKKLKAMGATHAILEKGMVQGPKTSKVAALSIGECIGMMESMLLALEIPYEIASPKQWQRVVFAGMNWSKNTKQAALLYVNRLMPGETWLRTPRCKKPHDGMIDAYCMAEYGLQKYH